MFKVFLIEITTPPFAVPSSLVKTIPVISATSLNVFACTTAFYPVVASTTNNTSLLASGNSLSTILNTLPNSFIRLALL